MKTKMNFYRPLLNLTICLLFLLVFVYPPRTSTTKTPNHQMANYVWIQNYLWIISLLLALQQRQRLSCCSARKNNHSKCRWWRRIPINRRKTSANSTSFNIVFDLIFRMVYEHSHAYDDPIQDKRSFI